VEYRESVYVGYRYYETAKKPVLFPFGHGLSYTDFTYSELKLDKDSCNYKDNVSVAFHITNNGQIKAKETAFVFVSHKNSMVFTPEKELKEFVKVELEPGETRQVMLTLDTGEFGYYNTLIKEWYAESGEYAILVGPSSDHCSLKTSLKLNSTDKPQPDYREKAPIYYQLPQTELVIPEREFEALYGGELPVSNGKPERPYDFGNTLSDVSHTLVGKMMISIIGKMAKKMTKGSKEEEAMMLAMMKEMPFHSMVASSGGAMSEAMMSGLVDMMNRHYLKGIRKMLKKK
jgi:beta-glucosidase